MHPWTARPASTRLLFVLLSATDPAALNSLLRTIVQRSRAVPADSVRLSCSLLCRMAVPLSRLTPMLSLLTRDLRVCLTSLRTAHMKNASLLSPSPLLVLANVPQHLPPPLVTASERDSMAGRARLPSRQSVSRHSFASLPLLQNGRTHLNRKRSVTVCRRNGTALDWVRLTTRVSSVDTCVLSSMLSRTMALRGFRILILFPSNSLLLGSPPLLTLLRVTPLQTLSTLLRAPGSLML